jgi:hypothetical protein
VPGQAAAQAARIAQLQGGNGNVSAIPQFIRADFAVATKDVLYGMGIVMAIAAVVAILGLRRGLQQDAAAETATVTSAANLPRVPDLPGCPPAETDDVAPARSSSR